MYTELESVFGRLFNPTLHLQVRKVRPKGILYLIINKMQVLPCSLDQQKKRVSLKHGISYPKFLPPSSKYSRRKEGCCRRSFVIVRTAVDVVGAPHPHLLTLTYKSQMLLSVNPSNSLVIDAGSVHMGGNLEMPQS